MSHCVDEVVFFDVVILFRVELCFGLLPCVESCRLKRARVCASAPAKKECNGRKANYRANSDYRFNSSFDLLRFVVRKDQAEPVDC
ncbi:MAG TPA: hypothetical protein DCG12_05155 [Planctomycetaceae bacterium]|nr:hypothetical protein [Planctomycetaceae bacterium]